MRILFICLFVYNFVVFFLNACCVLKEYYAELYQLKTCSLKAKNVKYNDILIIIIIICIWRKRNKACCQFKFLFNFIINDFHVYCSFIFLGNLVFPSSFLFVVVVFKEPGSIFIYLFQIYLEALQTRLFGCWIFIN